MKDDLELRNGIALQILRYLLDHPHAADRGAGVALWWLRNEGTVPQAVVQEVLECLVQRDWLQAYGGDSETRVYRFNHLEVDAVRRFTEARGEGRRG